jgi:hypothetical protein
MGLRPHPPRRPPNPGYAMGSASPRPSRVVEERCPPGAGRGFTGQGPRSKAARRLSSCRATWVAPGPTRTWIRTTELRPNPIRSSTSRRGTAGASAGDSDAARRCTAEAEHDASDDPTARTLPSRMNAKASGPCGRCMAHSREAGRPDGAPRAPLARSPRGSPDTGRIGPLAQSRHGPWPRAASPDAPRRAPGSAAPEVLSIDELPSLDTRRLPPAMQGSRPASSAGQGVLHRMSPTCGKHTAPLATFGTVGTALTSRPAAKARSPWWLGSG